MKGTLAAILLLLLLTPFALAASGSSSSEAFVRVVSADPASRTYTFRCIDQPGTSQIRDWFIRPDDGIQADEPNIADFQDRPANQDLTFTFPQNTFYHIGCNVVYDNGVLARGDLHIDLRANKRSWNPQIYMISGNGLTGTFQCDTRSGAVGHWEVLDARTHEVKSLGSGRQMTWTAPRPGLYDFFCSADGNRAPWPVEFFSSGSPYEPTDRGVPVSGQAQPPTCTPSTEVCDGKDNNCNGQTDENNVCGGTGNTCYSNVNDIPASCQGGSITTDEKGGCRKLVCASGGNSMQVLACDKGGFFEMYKQTVAGSGVSQICLGQTCISSSGYAKSPNYPICSASPACTPSNGGVEICDQKDNNCNGQVDENNVCSQPPTCTPTTEVCDRKDNDCDGAVDESNVCAAQSCHNSVQGIPATCEGASISSDTWNGGRTVVCGDTKIVAWDKTGYFEMYKQAGGSTVKICIDGACIKDNGYAKSGNFPICASTTPPQQCAPTAEVCDQKDNDCDGQVDESNVCTAPPTGACYSNVNDIPASCQGGNVIIDDKAGCRTLVCENGGNRLQIMACNKPDGSPSYFEMYRQMQAGSGLNLCIGSTCINDAGYAKSGNYPICS